MHTQMVLYSIISVFISQLSRNLTALLLISKEEESCIKPSQNKELSLNILKWILFPFLSPTLQLPCFDKQISSFFQNKVTSIDGCIKIRTVVVTRMHRFVTIQLALPSNVGARINPTNFLENFKTSRIDLWSLFESRRSVHRWTPKCIQISALSGLKKLNFPTKDITRQQSASSEVFSWISQGASNRKDKDLAQWYLHVTVIDFIHVKILLRHVLFDYPLSHALRYSGHATIASTVICMTYIDLSFFFLTYLHFSTGCPLETLS